MKNQFLAPGFPAMITPGDSLVLVHLCAGCPAFATVQSTALSINHTTAVPVCFTGDSQPPPVASFLKAEVRNEARKRTGWRGAP